MGNLDFNQSLTTNRAAKWAPFRQANTAAGSRTPSARTPKTVMRSICRSRTSSRRASIRAGKSSTGSTSGAAQNGQWVRRTDEAGNIAGQAMSELLAALGMATIRNHEELRGKSLVVKVKVRKSDEYGDSNDVQNY